MSIILNLKKLCTASFVCTFFMHFIGMSLYSKAIYAQSNTSMMRPNSFSLVEDTSHVRFNRTKLAYKQLAVFLAKHKRYSQALKYFALAGANNISVDSILSIPDILAGDTVLLHQKEKRVRSKALTVRQLTEPFRDEEQGTAYALLIHIKQPSAGHRQPFNGINNVGHTFITLIKYETEARSVSRTFGFYPNKEFLISGTPFLPDTKSTFKDDEEHGWDQTVGKFITYREFKQIIRLVRRYGKLRYHLNKNNCTDFGLCVAAIAGIKIKDTHGRWPLGQGNDPGDAGQSVLEGKVITTNSTEGLNDVFIITAENRAK